MGYFGSYSLKLCCDHEDHEKSKPITYKGITITACINNARKEGWIVSKGFKVCEWVKTHNFSNKGTGYCLCPEHSRKKIKVV